LSGEGLWREVLDARYGNWRKMDANSIHGYHSAWWLDVCRIFDKGELGYRFDPRCQWILGDGRCVNF